MAITRIELHVTDIGAFKACRRAWNWSSRLRGDLEPIRIYAPFFSGRAVHYCLERLHFYGEPWEDSLDGFVERETELLRQTPAIYEQERQTIDREMEMVRGMLSHYVAWEKRQKGPFALPNLEFITVEQEFSVAIIDHVTGKQLMAPLLTYDSVGQLLAVSMEKYPVFYVGKLDGLVRQRDTGKLYIWENKTARDISKRVAMLPVDAQATLYLCAAQQIFGESVAGMIYTIMKKSVPKPVPILKDGTLSRAVSGQSFESYYAAIKAHHGTEVRRDFITERYGATLLALNDSQEPVNTFFERHVVTRPHAALALEWEDLLRVAKEMTDPDIALYKTDGFHCQYCMYRDPCISLQHGQDYTVLLSDLYQKRIRHTGESDADTIGE